MVPMRQSPHFRHQSQLGVIVQDANRVGDPDAMYPSMGFPYTVHSGPRRVLIWNPAKKKVSLNEKRFK
jgi:hypothetical protein